MCDNRELERLREQRDDAIERAVAAGHERDALSDVLFDVTVELTESLAEIVRLRALLAAK